MLPCENMIFRSDDVSDAIMVLDDNKVSGVDNITAEHLQNASNRLFFSA